MNRSCRTSETSTVRFLQSSSSGRKEMNPCGRGRTFFRLLTFNPPFQEEGNESASPPSQRRSADSFNPPLLGGRK